MTFKDFVIGFELCLLIISLFMHNYVLEEKLNEQWINCQKKSIEAAKDCNTWIEDCNKNCNNELVLQRGYIKNDCLAIAGKLDNGKYYSQLICDKL